MREKLVKFLSILLLVAVAGGIGGYATYYFMQDEIKESNQIINQTTNTTGVVKCNSDITIDETGIAPAVGEIYDATVTLQNYQNGRLASSGSGFIYKKDEDSKYAYVLTNHHVVEGTDKLLVTLSSDDQVEGTVLGSDRYMDLAVVRIDGDLVKQVAKIGNSEESNVGDTVFTVGTPLGNEYKGTVTKGILSGKNRLVTVDTSTGGFVMEVLQTDAAMNPGNSGGPLCNVNGEVIGVNSLKLVEDEIEGMGFAIPSEMVQSELEALEQGQTIVRPRLGVEFTDLSNSYLLYRNGIMVDDDIDQGVVVVSVSNGTPASEAGLQKGDIITEMDGETVKSTSHFRYLLYKHQVGDTVTIKYIRNGNTEEATLHLNQEAS